DMERSQFLRQINYLIYSLEKRRCTALIILDESTTQNFGECVFHPFYGIIRLFRRDNPYTDSRERAIEIVKMRGVRTPIDYILFDITNQGIKMPQ
ncbi:MAG: ATPase domain-containing protein, partial [Methanomassiliicoccales archaeon]